jgi:2-polyprenyl-6-hydroxyphenyl methylase/3-demethylubiquinone-9 3-methyltransferase
MNIFRKFIDSQIFLSRYFDKIFMPKKFLIDGNQDFLKKFLPNVLENTPIQSTIYDIGCGKNPAISVEFKQKLQAKIIGIDWSADELLRAPVNALDECIEADICTYRGRSDGDLLLSQALFEHVPNVEAAFIAMASILRKGGVALIFVPSKNAVYARLNILLPHRFKLFLLHSIFPHTRGAQGFPSFYNLCTPGDFRRLARLKGFEVEEIRTYYLSSYFSIFFPIYLLWRFWILLFEKIDSEQSAETFCIKLRLN